jgi:5-hydroxyisourate hydrolase
MEKFPMGKLTTHVLDTYSGVPAASLRIQLWRFGDDGSRIHLKTIDTNGDGRSGEPLLDSATMTAGEYELVFFVREYFAAKGVTVPFLTHVPVRFVIFDVAQNYHVPLLVSPWAYSTYRGS